MNYQKPYTLLFNAITDALEQLDGQDIWQAREILVRAQQQAEEMYISAKDASEE